MHIGREEIETSECTIFGGTLCCASPWVFVHCARCWHQPWGVYSPTCSGLQHAQIKSFNIQALLQSEINWMWLMTGTSMTLSGTLGRFILNQGDSAFMCPLAFLFLLPAWNSVQPWRPMGGDKYNMWRMAGWQAESQQSPGTTMPVLRSLLWTTWYVEKPNKQNASLFKEIFCLVFYYSWLSTVLTTAMSTVYLNEFYNASKWP